MIRQTEFLQSEALNRIPHWSFDFDCGTGFWTALTRAWTKYAETDWLCKVARDRVGRVITRLMCAHRSTVNCQFVINYAPILAGLTKLAIFSFLASKRKLLIICENSFDLPYGPNIARTSFRIRYMEMDSDNGKIHSHRFLHLPSNNDALCKHSYWFDIMCHYQVGTSNSCVINFIFL